MTDDELSQWLLRNAGPGVGREAQRKLDSIWWGSGDGASPPLGDVARLRAARDTRADVPMMLLAIDPGPVESGWVLIDTADNCRPAAFDKMPNGVLRSLLPDLVFDSVVIEMIASYGMAVGAEVFTTCVEIGRLFQIVTEQQLPVELMFRREVKLHLCGTAKAKDANITQALIDRFACGQPNRGKGSKAAPGWFHGFRADVWAAYALAVTAADGLG